MTIADDFICTRLGVGSIIFDFERDFAGELKCMPMIVRLKLDRCGVKLSLKQWNKLDIVDRRDLASAPCDTVAEVDDYGSRIVTLLASKSDVASRFQIDLAPVWERDTGPPAQVSDFASAAGLRPPTSADWAKLSPLQRFVLLKLTRPNHTNANLGDAMREFGLTT